MVFGQPLHFIEECRADATLLLQTVERDDFKLVFPNDIREDADDDLRFRSDKPVKRGAIIRPGRDDHL